MIFKSYIYRLAVRYFFSKDSKTIVNRINGFAFLMIVAASCVLLIVLSAFAGLKDFGLAYTSSFDPDLKIIPETGSYFTLKDEDLDKIRGFDFVKEASPVIEEKVVLSNELNSGATILKGVNSDYHLLGVLDSLSLIGVFSPSKDNSLYLGADLASSLEVVMSEDFSLLATAAKKKNRSLFSFTPFNSTKLEIEGIYQISLDIEKKYAFAPIKTVGSLVGVNEKSYTSIEVITNGFVSKESLTKEVKGLFSSNVVVLDKQDLNPALYKMLNTENLAVYLIFSLVALIAMFNLVGSLTIMMVEKKKDLRVLKSLGGKEGDFNKIFFTLGIFTSTFGAFLGIIIAWVLVVVQKSYSFVLVPGTSLPYPISLTFMNVFIVFSTIFFLGVLTSAWSTSQRGKP
ncbi:FtsX-like permease family protein [Flavobacteriaceae bacterium]|nr:FtsX-like permease family protein [Flavobacteriaceae bacterium]